MMALAVPFRVMRGESYLIGLHMVVGRLVLSVAGGRLTPAPPQPGG